MARPFVRDKNDVLDNFSAFIALRQSDEPATVAKYRSYLKSAKVLVVAKVDGRREYAPSRFVGYRANSLAKHKKGHEAQLNDGTATNTKLTELFGKLYYADPEEDKKFQAFCVKHEISKDLNGLTTPLKYIFADYAASSSAIHRKQRQGESDSSSDLPAVPLTLEPSCYLLGAVWKGAKPENQLSRFLEQGVWENGHDANFTEVVNTIPVGSTVYVKAHYFDQGIKKPLVDIRARGVVTGNPQSGHDLLVAWEKGFSPYKLTDAELPGVAGRYWNTVDRVTEPTHLAWFLHGIKPKPFLKKMPISSFPRNQILYGPPGTGKTYHTIARAVALLEDISDEELAKKYPPANREALREKFEDYRKAQRIEFVTFHQAFSYEDFIEGIKPLPPAKQDESLALTTVSKPVQYDVVPGVFRRVCEAAAAAANTAEAPPLPEFDVLYDEFVADLKGRMTSTNGSLSFYTITGEPVTLTDANVDLPTRRLTFLHDNSAQQNHYIDKQWIQKLYEKYASIDQIKNLTKDITKAVGGSNGSLMWVVFNELKKYEAAWLIQERGKQQTKPAQPFVLIIDEINRGNVANIFGELITLLEDDKRTGRPEALTLRLPYSKQMFSVPHNLYLLGTMNTADRSVEALDTALRRRFSFTEMKPQPELLSPHQMIARLWLRYADEPWDGATYKPAETELYNLLGCADLAKEDQEPRWERLRLEGMAPKTTKSILDDVKMTGVDLEKLLHAINARLEQLLDHDHCIGHALLIHVHDFASLQEAFRRNILPLLQEYFFSDWGKLGLVLGGDFVKQVNLKQAPSIKLKSFPGYSSSTMSELSEKPVYRITDPADLEPKHFQEIYA